MAEHVHATQQPLATTASGSASKQSSDATVSFTDQRPEAIVQRKLVEKAAGFSSPNVIQRVSMSDTEMRTAGFRKYGSGVRWQYNYGGGIHISPIRNNEEIGDFHVVLETKGKVRSRLDYKEGKNNQWSQDIGNRNSVVQTAHLARKREMQEAAIYTVRALFKGTIADLPPLPVARATPAPAPSPAPSPTGTATATPVTIESTPTATPASTGTPTRVAPVDSVAPTGAASGNEERKGGGGRSGAARRKTRKAGFLKAPAL